MTTRTELFRLDRAVERDPAIAGWMKEHAGELGAIAQKWFEVMRKCRDEVQELLHDGCPTACMGDAAFGYVNDISIVPHQCDDAEQHRRRAKDYPPVQRRLH